jgi:hypothetical protein
MAQAAAASRGPKWETSWRLATTRLFSTSGRPGRLAGRPAKRPGLGLVRLVRLVRLGLGPLEGGPFGDRALADLLGQLQRP